MSIDNASGKFGTDFDIRVFDKTDDLVTGGASSFTYFPTADAISSSVSETTIGA
jgi:hypothetical protein